MSTRTGAPTLYEMIIEIPDGDGCMRRWRVGYYRRKTREMLAAAACSSKPILTRFERKEITREQGQITIRERKSGEALAVLRWSGRTERDARSEGELPFLPFDARELEV